MTLDELIDQARSYVMTDDEREAQARSFAYGNVRLHNPSVTMDDINREADRLLADR